jgi:type II secretory pathway component GspD/PulD (secretin)
MVTVVAEPMSNSLIVTANAQNLVKVNALLAKLDTEVAGGMRTELLLLKNAKAPDVAPVLAKMALSTGPVAAGGRGALGATGGIGAVNVSADAGSNGLVISGPSADVDKVIKMALDLDKATGESIVKMYPLKNADVASTVQALQDLFGSAARGAMGARGATKGQADLSNITVTGDPAGRQVIVLAPAEKQELVAKVITEMDLAQSVDEVTVKIYHLINSDAVSVAPALSATVERAPGATAAGRGVGATALTGQIRISADRSSNSIIVRAGKEDHERIAKLIVDLDVAPTEQFAVRLIQLNTADATNVAAVLTRIFTGQSSTAAAGAARGAGASGPRQAVVIEADRDSHMLMVRADDTTFEKIKALAEKMDTGSKGQAMPTVIALKFAQAAGVAPTLQAAFAARSTVAGRGGVPANPDDMVTVVAEPMSNSLIVTANTQNLEKFNALLAQLDTQIAGGIRTELIILKNAKAVDVAPVLTRMVQTAASGGKGAAAAAAVSISAETGSNGLVVSGPSSEVEKVMKMVDDIDQASIGTLSSVYVVALKNGDATSVAQMVHDLYTQQQQAALRDKKSIDPLAVTSDLRSNAIVLATTKQMYEQVTLWVNQIESMQPARGSVRIISLQNADPTDLNNAIRQIFPSGTGTPTIPLRRGPNGAVGATGAAGAPTGGTTSGKVDATVLPAQRSVLISASDEDFETIKKLAEAMDAAAADAKRQVKVFPLKHGNNTRIALALTNMYRAGAQRLGPTTGTVDDSVTVTALPDTNAVVVSATKTRMEEVAHLIEELDRVEIAPQLEYHIYPLQNATPTKLLPQITLMVAQLRMTRPDEPIGVQADERTRSIIITARGPMYEQVSKIIETLDKAPSFAQVEVLIVPLKRADATRLALVLNDMLKPSLTGQATPEAVALQEQVRLLRVQGREGEKVPELDLTKPIKITADARQPEGDEGDRRDARRGAAGRGRQGADRPPPQRRRRERRGDSKGYLHARAEAGRPAQDQRRRQGPARYRQRQGPRVSVQRVGRYAHEQPDHERHRGIAGPGRPRCQGPGPRLGQDRDGGAPVPPQVRRCRQDGADAPGRLCRGRRHGRRRCGGGRRHGCHRRSPDPGHTAAHGPRKRGRPHDGDPQDARRLHHPGRSGDEHRHHCGPERRHAARGRRHRQDGRAGRRRDERRPHLPAHQRRCHAPEDDHRRPVHRPERDARAARR